MATRTKRRRRVKKDTETKALSTEVQWGEYDEEAAEAHERELDEGSSSQFERKLEVGKNYRRILPPPKGSGWGKNGADSPVFSCFEHVINLPGMERMLRFPCPKKAGEGPCFACTLSQQLRNGSPKDRDIGYEIGPRRANYLQWVDSRSDDEPPEVKVYNAGKTIASELVDLRLEHGDYSHPTKGYEVIIKRTGTTRKDTKYRVRAGDTLPIEELGLEPSMLIDLSQFGANPPDEDAQEEMQEMIDEAMTGGAGRRRRDDDDDERGSRTRRSRRSRRSEDDDDDVIEAEYEEVDDDDDEDDAPRKKRRRRKRR